MGHLERREGDTFYMRGWWYRDEDEWRDLVAEYRRPEYHDADRTDDEDEDDGYRRA